MSKPKRNFPEPSTLPTSELVRAFVRWEAGGMVEHEARLAAWLELCANELDKRLPIPRGLICAECGAPAFSAVQHAGDECGRFTSTDPRGCKGRLRREIDR